MSSGSDSLNHDDVNVNGSIKAKAEIIIRNTSSTLLNHLNGQLTSPNDGQKTQYQQGPSQPHILANEEKQPICEPIKHKGKIRHVGKILPQAILNPRKHNSCPKSGLILSQILNS
jgi:hypothetical protein